MCFARRRLSGKRVSRRGSPCQSPAMVNGRCRMHGGASPGAPKGNRNAVKHGRYTAKAIEDRDGCQPAKMLEATTRPAESQKTRGLIRGLSVGRRGEV
jgi:hypothetical protein